MGALAVVPRSILVIGRNGQLAQELLHLDWPDGVSPIYLGRREIDISGREGLALAINAHRPSVIINTAAYTAVDRAETEREAAFALNGEAPRRIAEAAAASGIPLIHVSTDYVFDGEKKGAYLEDESVRPISVYGASKAAGEVAIREILRQHVILRSSWLFGRLGQNFLNTMLRLAETKDHLSVVDDQIGGPTPTADLAAAIQHVTLLLAAGKTDGFGTFHFTGRPGTTWFEFAAEIFAAARDLGRKVPELQRMTSAQFASPARRPINSVLDCGKISVTYGLAQPDWRLQIEPCVRAVIGDLGASRGD